MSSHIVDPFAAMSAACIAISNGEANEIELSFSTEHRAPGGMEPDRRDDLTITVRREVRHFYPPATPASDEDGGS